MTVDARPTILLTERREPAASPRGVAMRHAFAKDLHAR
jgi:hypothetical protein